MIGHYIKVVCLLTLLSQLADAQDLVIADFEGDSYGPWRVEGEAFGTGPAKGTLPGQMPVDNFLGRGLVNSFNKGDNAVGALTSPVIKIERKYITFLIGGGKHPEQLTIQLLIDGQVVRSATGSNDRPGGTEALGASSWEVSEFIGKDAVIKIIDQAQSSWGHINIDQIVQTDKKPPGLRKDVERTLLISSRYLLIPVKDGAAKRVLTFLVDGQQIVRNDIELADGPADWLAPMDVSGWKGKSITVRVDQLREDSKALDAVSQSDQIPAVVPMYREPLRGQFHFSPKRGWNNDPNGLVYFNDEYHLFFQHNPYGWGWGNMHWGHAVSKDLVHWEELGDVLWPDRFGPMFSGSAVVDWKNTSGFGQDGKPPMVLFYTAAGNPTVQCIAYSLDGRSFTKYERNPVLPEITGGNRDPKVFWHAPSQSWVMVLYVELNKVHTIHFFTSKNLKDWTFASKTDGFFECPDFFELPVDGDSKRKKWVLLGASSEYRVGEFDGQRFLSDSPKLPGHRGRGFYAAQSFSDVPDGRRIFIGWFQTETKGMPFNQSMTIPLQLGLTQTEDGPRLTFAPIKELEQLRVQDQAVQISDLVLASDSANPLASLNGELIELRADIETAGAKELRLQVRSAEVVYDVAKQEVSVAGHRAPAPLRDGRLRLTIYCDRTGIELFASDGLTYIPFPINHDPQKLDLQLTTTGGPVKIQTLEAYRLQSAWSQE